MAPICKLQPLIALVSPVSSHRLFSTVVSFKQNEAYPKLDDIYKIPFASRQSHRMEPSTSNSASTYSSTYSSSPLSYELSDVLARVFRKGISVTTILSETMPPESRFALLNWRRNQIALVFAGDEAAFAAEMQRVRRTGVHLHACIARHLSGGEPIGSEQLAATRERHSIEGFWNSMYPVFEDITGAHLSEVHLAHPLLYYTGVFDSLIEYKCAALLILSLIISSHLISSLLISSQTLEPLVEHFTLL